MGLLDYDIELAKNKLRSLLDAAPEYVNQLTQNVRNITGQNNATNLFAMRNLDAMAGGDLKQNISQNVQEGRDKGMEMALNFNPSAVGMTAWHGSPHKFDKFDLAKIGTGEGAQPWKPGEWKGLLDEAPKVPEAPYAEAHRIAQRNAALPVEQGGLGLPANNTAMDRAKAMGFDTPAYHATGTDFNEFIPHPYRGASSVAATPDGAISGAKAGAADMTGSGSSIVMPLMMMSKGIDGLSLSKPMREFLNSIPEKSTESQVNELMKHAPPGSNWLNFFKEIENPDGSFSYAKKTDPKVTFLDVQKTHTGADGQRVPNWGNERWSSNYHKKIGNDGWIQADESGVSASVINPSILRSRFAAFDPMRRHEADLLGYATVPNMLVGSLLGAGGLYGLGLLENK